MPQNVQPDEQQPPVDSEGYYVFGRILAKPNNNKNNECDGVNRWNIILYSNHVIEACNDSSVEPAEGEKLFGEYTDCDGDLALGLIVEDNLYIADPKVKKYVSFDPTSDGGRRKSKATDITRLFTYTG